MAFLIREGIQLYKYVIYDLSDPRTQEWFLVPSPFPILAILFAYVYFVKTWGPRWMENRPAFNLDRVVQVYDVIQIVLSLGILYIATTKAWFGGYNWICEPVDYSMNENSIIIAHTVFYYYMIKILDLLDTVFFVLRKKNSQITFLHVYHHAGMVAFMWGGTKFLPGGHGTFLGFVNSIVHIVMYSYYLVTSIYPQHKKNIWWKKHITQLQMVQFMMIIIHTGQLLLLKNPCYPRWVAFFLVPQNAFMFAMFYDFYRKAYFPKKPKPGETVSPVELQTQKLE